MYTITSYFSFQQLIIMNIDLKNCEVLVKMLTGRIIKRVFVPKWKAFKTLYILP